MKNVLMVVDLQFGSTGKGQLAGTVGRAWGADTAVCANGPNAGHTYKWVVDDVETPAVIKVVHTVMPVGAVLPSVRNILIGPGAVLDLERLRVEIETSPLELNGKSLIIHPNAMLVQPRHVDGEKELMRIGSTMKGTAEAMIEKIRRPPNAATANNLRITIGNYLDLALSRANMSLSIDRGRYDWAVDSSLKLMVEGAQGHSLSIHSQFYPYTTSRDVSVNQIWADCHLPTRVDSMRVLGVCRTYPIRVASRKNEIGETVGYSGGYYDDQGEIPWCEIEREPELTTVTKLPRRLFTFSTEQIIEAARFNGPTDIALTFCDYVADVQGRNGETKAPVGPGKPLSPGVMSYIRRIEAAAGCKVWYLSYGPTDLDVYGINRDSSPWTLQELYKGGLA